MIVVGSAVASDTPAIDMEEALRRMLDLVAPLAAEVVPLTDCLGRVLAEDITLNCAVPSRDCAARDGYAIRSAETWAAGPHAPVVLRVGGELRPSVAHAGELPAGAALRVATGAPLPAGADAVVPFECVAGSTDGAMSGRSPVIRIGHFVRPGWNVRPAGADLAGRGEMLGKGTSLRPPHVGVLAALGRHAVKVTRRPSVALLATGDEVVEPNGRLSPGRINNSNGYAMAALVQHYGGVTRLLGTVRDDRRLLEARLREGLTADLILTTGGASRGPHDLVGLVLKEAEEVSFWHLPVRSSKPLTFRVLRDPATGRRVCHLALPGKPLGAIVAFELFARPLLLRLQGRPDTGSRFTAATVEVEVANPCGRHLYVPVQLLPGEPVPVARLASPAGGELHALSEADGLAVIPPTALRLRAGDTVKVMIPDWAGRRL